MKQLFQLLVVVAIATCVAAPVSAASECCQSSTEQCHSKKTKKGDKIVSECLKADIHCEKCEETIMRTLPYKKGVKDVRVCLKNQTIDVKYDISKCSKADIVKELSKIDIKTK